MHQFTKSVKTVAVEERLRHGKIGDEIPFKEMEDLTGLRCEGSKTEGFVIVARTIPKMERQCGLFWRWQRHAKSWLCIDDEKKTLEVIDRLTIVSRQTRRNSLICNSIDYVKLPEGMQLEAMAAANLSAAINCLASKKTVQRLARPGGMSFPTEQTLVQLFRSKNGREAAGSEEKLGDVTGCGEIGRGVP